MTPNIPIDRGRMASATNAGGTTSFLYNALKTHHPVRPELVEGPTPSVGFDRLNPNGWIWQGSTSYGYDYDAIGNRKTLTVSGMAYSDRLSTTTVPAGTTTSTTTYRFNALEQRAFKIGTLVNSGVAFYVYDEADHLLGEYDVNGSPLYEVIWLGDLPLGVMKQTKTGNLVSTRLDDIYTDHLNAPRVITRGSDQAILWRWESTEPFGATLANDNPSALGTYPFNLRLPGQVFDKETGWAYNHHRDYDPYLGRYIQSDPIGLKGGINTYGYVGGNPIGYVDPLGLYTEIVVWSPAGIGGSSFGHVSTNVNGTNYSWGPGGWDTKYPTASGYNKRQGEFRGGRGVILNLSSMQEAELSVCMKEARREYSVFSNNCGTPPQECLKKIGVDIGSSLLPKAIFENLKESPLSSGTVIYPGPRDPTPFTSSPFWR